MRVSESRLHFTMRLQSIVNHSNTHFIRCKQKGISLQNIKRANPRSLIQATEHLNGRPQGPFSFSSSFFACTGAELFCPLLATPCSFFAGAACVDDVVAAAADVGSVFAAATGTGSCFPAALPFSHAKLTLETVS